MLGPSEWLKGMDEEASESTTLLADRQDSLLSEHGSVSSREYVQIAASRLMYSQSCSVFYFSLLAASLTEIVWILHPYFLTCKHAHADCTTWKVAYPRSRVFYAVEAYLTVGLVLETALRALWQGWAAFQREPHNVFDVAVCMLSVLSFTLTMESWSADVEAVVLGLMLTWLALRLARLVSAAQKLASRRRMHASSLDLDLDPDLDAHADDELEMTELGGAPSSPWPRPLPPSPRGAGAAELDGAARPPGPGAGHETPGRGAASAPLEPGTSSKLAR